MSHKRTFTHLVGGRKLPEFRWKIRGLRLALTMLVLVCPQGCLIPQSVDPIIVSPHPAPHFVLENIPTYLINPLLQLTPRGTTDPAGCHCQIEIPPLFVEEDDPTVTLEARWFIDYDPAVPRSQAPWPGSTQTLLGTFNDPTALVRSLNKFDFDAADAGIVTSGVHLLEVIVGEQDGFDDSSGVTLPNRTMKQGFSAALYRFAINVNTQVVAGNCPQQLPAVPVCQ